jgi:hypothetical protein
LICRCTRCSACPTANGWYHRRGQGGCHGSWPSIREFCYAGHRYAGGEFSVSGSGGLGSFQKVALRSLSARPIRPIRNCRSRASTAALIPDGFSRCELRVQRACAAFGRRSRIISGAWGRVISRGRSLATEARRLGRPRFCPRWMLLPWWARQPAPRPTRAARPLAGAQVRPLTKLRDVSGK